LTHLRKPNKRIFVLGTLPAELLCQLSFGRCTIGVVVDVAA
jgi:hypothetical protein